ncbi:hypothetical protein [Herpetosiphon gulosus]|uniref:Uncharacterized protein n=1 Tax=Herpetosiphon gulosus TaxID=1973496 RepID=A0ABP9WUE0_9CHLR
MQLAVSAKPETPLQPYVVSADYAPGTLIQQQTLELPIYHSPEQKLYELEIAGFRVEDADPETALRQAVPVLKALVNLARLPTYVFIARRSRQVYPIYSIGDDVLATTPGGPVFRHVELAKVREYLNEYLHLTGVLGRPGASDKLHVRGVDAKTMGLIRPTCYFKKRITGQTDFWAPVFANDQELYAFAASKRHAVPLSEPNALMGLHALVAKALIKDKRLFHEHDLRVDRMFAEPWEIWKKDLTAVNEPIVLGAVSLNVYQYGPTWLAVEKRRDRDELRPSLFLGENLYDLTARVTADFKRRGLIAE